MPLELWNPRWARSLQRLFNTKGGSGSPVQVLDDFMPVVPVIDAAQNEHHFYRGEVPWAIGTSGPQLAANYGQVTLQAQPGWLVVVETISLGAATAGVSVQAGIGSLGGAAAPASLPAPCDLRVPAVPGLLWDASNNAAAFAGSEIGRWYIGALSPSQIVFSGEQAIVLYNLPGALTPATSAFHIKGNVVNVGFNVVLTGYSRPLDAGEVNP
jgi:hypothetical protein